MNNGAFHLGPQARLTLIFLFSLALHVVILIGLGFTWQTEHAQRIPPIIEITLAQRSQVLPPQEFEILARANQNAIGKAKRNPKPQEQRPASIPASLSAAEAKSPQEHESAVKPTNARAKRAVASATAAEHLEMAEVRAISRRVASSIAFAGVVASLNSHYPSERRIDARTNSYAAAEYLRQWVEKVERIGNLNYPRAARERDLSGRLILEVSLRPDGSVYAINVLVPSPFSVLNQAAKRIVKLAQPYAKVPREVLQGHDLLVITRSWEFDDARRFYPH
ncbi:MAG: TonB family protein [Nitrococcus sp.]|nr:TonB family protein [Nitrococcus sp.]